MKLSIAIPYHDTPKTAFYLSRLLKSVEQQTFKDYEVVLTKEGPFAHNHNAAIAKATGDIVQMLQMDDYFESPQSLGNIVKSFENEKVIWQITGSLHDSNGAVGNLHIPKWTDDIFTGNNRLGSVSTLSFRRDKAIQFEEPLTWVVDCDLYYRLFLKYGRPYICPHPNVVIDVRTDRLSSTLSNELKSDEINYLLKKYGK